MKTKRNLSILDYMTPEDGVRYVAGLVRAGLSDTQGKRFNRLPEPLKLYALRKRKRRIR